VSEGAAGLEAPGIDLTIGLWALVSLLVLMGLKASWDYTLGALLNTLANVLDVHVWRINLNVSGPLLALNHAMERRLGQAILRNEQALGLWWHANTQVVSYTGDALLDFSSAMHDFGVGLVHGTIPAVVADTVKPVAENVGHADRAARARSRTEAKARAAGIEAGVRDIGAERLARERGIDNIRARDRAYTDAQVGHAEGQIAKERAYSHRILGRRLSLLEKLLGVGALGGIAVAALTRVFPYWQCSNVRRVMRGICRSPLGALDWLFVLELEAFVVSDLCDFIAALSKAAETAEPLLLAFVSAEDALIGCRGATKPPRLPFGDLGIPLESAGISLAA
jgi:hypothetical protein